MRLSWRDGVSALLVGVCGVIFLAVSDGWGWPLLDDYQAGAAALLVVGLAACIVGGSSARIRARRRSCSAISRPLPAMTPIPAIAGPSGK